MLDRPSRPRISPKAFEEVQHALEQYRLQVDNAGLSSRSVGAYYRGAEQFVRWLNYEFRPGRNKR